MVLPECRRVIVPKCGRVIVPECGRVIVPECGQGQAPPLHKLCTTIIPPIVHKMQNHISPKFRKFRRDYKKVNIGEPTP
jgi:hypothetical protein